MLNDGSGFKKVYLATGFTDLRRGIDGLARIIRFQFQLDPYDNNTLFLFCGKRTDRIKGIIWEGVVVKHFCNTLFENSPGISSFKWCFPIIVGMRTDMIVPYVHISV